MKAIVNSRYGSPDVFVLKDIEKPSPKDDEVLIKVHASCINSWEWDILTGKPYIYRTLHGLFKPKHKILGCDISGKVEAIGKNIKRFRPGDDVYGDLSGYSWGGFAEYVCASEKYLAKKPARLSFEEAASVPQAGVLALQGLNSKGITPGQKVLINGAGGGVGSFGVQLAKLSGAEVTCVDSVEKLGMLNVLGADYVIDYTKEDFSKIGKQYDLIIDNVASRSLSECSRALSPNGQYIIIGGNTGTIFKTMLFGKWFHRKTGKKFNLLLHKPNIKDLDYLSNLFDNKKIKPVIDKCYSLEDVPEAFRYYGEGRFKGKIVISVQE